MPVIRKPGVLFVGMLLTTNSISLVDLGLFRLHTFWVNSGFFCLGKNLFSLSCCYWHFKYQKMFILWQFVGGHPVTFCPVHLLVGAFYPFNKTFKSEKQHNVVNKVYIQYIQSDDWGVNDIIRVKCLVNTNLNNPIFVIIFISVISRWYPTTVVGFASDFLVFQTTKAFLSVLN